MTLTQNPLKSFKIPLLRQKRRQFTVRKVTLCLFSIDPCTYLAVYTATDEANGKWCIYHNYIGYTNRLCGRPVVDHSLIVHHLKLCSTVPVSYFAFYLKLLPEIFIATFKQGSKQLLT